MEASARNERPITTQGVSTTVDKGKKRARAASDAECTSPTLEVPPPKKPCDDGSQSDTQQAATIFVSHPSTSTLVGGPSTPATARLQVPVEQQASPSSSQLKAAVQIDEVAVQLPSSSQTEPESPLEQPVGLPSSSQTEPETQIEEAVQAHLPSSSQTEPESPLELPVALPSPQQPEPEPGLANPAISSQTEPESQVEEMLDSPRSLGNLMLSDDDKGPGADETQYVPDSEGEEELRIPRAQAARWPIRTHGKYGVTYRHPPDLTPTQVEEYFDDLMNLPGTIPMKR